MQASWKPNNHFIKRELNDMLYVIYYVVYIIFYINPSTDFSWWSRKQIKYLLKHYIFLLCYESTE